MRLERRQPLLADLRGQTPPTWPLRRAGRRGARRCADHPGPSRRHPPRFPEPEPRSGPPGHPPGTPSAGIHSDSDSSHPPSRPGLCRAVGWPGSLPARPSCRRTRRTGPQSIARTPRAAHARGPAAGAGGPAAPPSAQPEFRLSARTPIRSSSCWISARSLASRARSAAVSGRSRRAEMSSSRPRPRPDSQNRQASRA